MVDINKLDSMQHDHSSLNNNNNNNNSNILGEVELRSFGDSYGHWREFNISSSGSSSSGSHHPQNKYYKKDRSGGYTFKDVSITKNRFILWRVSGHQLELSEYHLQHKLYDESIRINFQSAILNDIDIFEYNNQYVVIMVLLENKSFYRFILPHPISIENNQYNRTSGKRKGESSQHNRYRSIFSDLQINDLDNQWSRIKSILSVGDGTDITIVRCISPTLLSIGTTNHGCWWIELADIKRNGDLSYTKRFELKEGNLISSMFNRYSSFLGLGSSDGQSQQLQQQQQQQSLSSSSLSTNSIIEDLQIIINGINGNPIIFVLQRDNNLRVWSPSEKQCIATLSIQTESWGQITIDSPPMKSFKIRQVDQLQYLLVVFVELENESYFQFYSVSIEQNNIIGIQLQRVSYIKKNGLVDFNIYNDSLYTLWNHGDSTTVSYVSINDPTLDSLNMEFNMHSEAIMLPGLVREKAPTGDTIELHYLERIFNRGYFTNRSIQQSLILYNTGGDAYLLSNTIPLEQQVSSLIKEKISKELNNINGGDSQKKVPQSQVDLITYHEWSHFYDLCLSQVKQDTLATGLYINYNLDLIFIIKKKKLSLLRPQSKIESLLLLDNNIKPCQLNELWGELSNNSNDQILLQDFVKIIKCCDLINNVVENDYSTFEYEVSRNQTESAIFTEVDSILSSPFSSSLLNKNNQHQIQSKNRLKQQHQRQEQSTAGASFISTASEVILPNSMVDQVTNNYNSIFVIEIIKSFKTIQQPIQSITTLLEMLSKDFIDNGNNSIRNESSPSSSSNNEQQRVLSSSNDLGSDLYNDILVSIFNRTVSIKYGFVRSISILLTILARLSPSLNISINQLNELEAIISPRYHILLNTYYVLFWFSNQIYYPDGGSSTTVVDLNSFTEVNNQHHHHSNLLPQQSNDLEEMDNINLSGNQIKLFKNSIIYHLVSNNMHVFCQNNSGTKDFFKNLNESISKLIYLLTPNMDIFPLATYLTEKSQFKQLSVILTMVNQNQLLTSHNNNTTPFYYLMGLCFAHFSKYKESYDYLIKATQSMAQFSTNNNNMDDEEITVSIKSLIRICLLSDDELVPNILVDRSEIGNITTASSSLNILMSRFFLKCSKVLELRNQLEYVIQLNLLAIKYLTFEILNQQQIVEPTSSNTQHELLTKISNLYLNVFKYSMKIQQYDLSYQSIVKNPIQKESFECLQKLLIHLCEHNQIDLLCSLPYVGIYHLVEEILLSKAKNQDLLLKPDYYSILYTLQISRSNYKKAALNIYEKSQRVIVESYPSVKKGVLDIDLLYKTKLDYLALAINTLQLISDEKNQWISTMDGSSYGNNDDTSSSLSLMNSGGNYINNTHKRKISTPNYKSSFTNNRNDDGEDDGNNTDGWNLSLTSLDSRGDSSNNGSLQNDDQSDMFNDHHQQKESIQIIWLNDLVKEYTYYQSLITIRELEQNRQQQPPPIISRLSSLNDKLSVKQVIDELLKNDYIDQSFTLALQNDLDLGFIFQEFTLKCLEYQLDSTSKNPFALNHETLDTTLFDHMSDKQSISWRVLEMYLKKYDTTFSIKCLTPSQVYLNQVNGDVEESSQEEQIVYGTVLPNTLTKLNDGYMFRIVDTQQLQTQQQLQQKQQQQQPFYFDVLCSNNQKIPFYFKEGYSVIVKGKLHQQQQKQQQQQQPIYRFIANQVYCTRSSPQQSNHSYHDLVTNTILSYQQKLQFKQRDLPTWLLNQYKENARLGQLFTLYFRNNRIEQAANTLLEFLESLLKTKKQNLKYILIPFNHIDQFLSEADGICQSSSLLEQNSRVKLNNLVESIKSFLQKVILLISK